MHINQMSVLHFAFLVAIPAYSQRPSPAVTPGIYESHLRFGPDIRGTLTITQTRSGLRAEVAGTRVEFSARHDTISFDLPNHGGSLIAYLSKDQSTISGHWIQPPTVSSGTEYASPITLKRDAPGRWVSTVNPLDDTMTLYLVIHRRADGSLGAFIRNPERNLGRQLRLDRVEVKDSTVRAIGKRNGNGVERALGAGNLTDDGFTLNFPGRGTFDFRKLANSEYTDFYPRGHPSGAYSYATPPTLNDGWATATPASVGLSQDTLANFMRAVINEGMDSLSTPQIHAVLVVRHNRLVLEEYFHGEHRDHAHDTRSAGKSITSTIAGAVVHSNRNITLASPVYAMMNGGTFPDSIEPRKKRITLEHFLSMSSGIDCDDSDNDSPGNESTMLDQTDEPDYYKFTLKLKTIREPGVKAVYCSVQPNLAGGALQRATHRWLPDLFSELVARPLGIGNYYLPLSPTRDAYMGGGVRITAREFTKIGQMYLDSGVYNGKRILDKSYVKKAGTPAFEMNDGGYGLGWWVKDYVYSGDTYQAYFASGNGGQFVIVIPKLDMVVTFYSGNYQDRLALLPETVYLPKYILPAVLR